MGWKMTYIVSSGALNSTHWARAEHLQLPKLSNVLVCYCS